MKNIIEICDILDKVAKKYGCHIIRPLDRESIKYLISNNFNLKQAINFIWYFGVYDEKYKINNEIFDYYTNFNYQEKFDLKELIITKIIGNKKTADKTINKINIVALNKVFFFSISAFNLLFFC